METDDTLLMLVPSVCRKRFKYTSKKVKASMAFMHGCTSRNSSGRRITHESPFLEAAATFGMEFSWASDADIIRNGVFEVKTTEDLNDLRLGASVDERCLTCGNGWRE